MIICISGNPGLGMQLSLADFECEDTEAPRWLPAEKWEDILALSVLPGPLDSLCVHMARESDVWRDWYHSEKPEDLDLPIPNPENETDSADKEEEGDILTIIQDAKYCISNIIF